MRRGAAVLKGPLLLGLAPEDFIFAVGVKGQFGVAHWSRIDVDQINAGIGQLGELFEIIAARLSSPKSAIDDAGIEQGRRPTGAAVADSSAGLPVLPFFAMR
jgi:hypothetical protein